jgi:hypothetical protein
MQPHAAYAATEGVSAKVTEKQLITERGIVYLASTSLKQSGSMMEAQILRGVFFVEIFGEEDVTRMLSAMLLAFSEAKQTSSVLPCRIFHLPSCNLRNSQLPGTLFCTICDP